MISDSYRWLFDGVGGAAAIALVSFAYRLLRNKDQAPSAGITAQGAKVQNSPVASGTAITQNINSHVNSPTVNLSLPAPAFGTPGRGRYEEWRELIDEIHEAIEQMGWAFVPMVAYKAGDERCDSQAGIRRGNRVLGNRILIADAVQKSGLKDDWDVLVQYAAAGRGPRDYRDKDVPTMGGFNTRERQFQEKLMRVARQDMARQVDNNWVEQNSHEEGPRPLVIPLRYGAATITAGKRMLGYYGLIVANHGEPAYDVSILTTEIPIGSSKLKFDGSKPALTKADGEAFFHGFIQESPGHSITGSGLFEEMRKHHVSEIEVELVYKDSENRWYKTVGTIERNVSEPGGLSVRYGRRETTAAPIDKT